MFGVLNVHPGWVTDSLKGYKGCWVNLLLITRVFFRKRIILMSSRYQLIWFYQVIWWCKLATIKSLLLWLSIGYSGQFRRPTQVIKPNYLVILHQRSTIVSLETYPSSPRYQLGTTTNWAMRPYVWRVKKFIFWRVTVLIVFSFSGFLEISVLLFDHTRCKAAPSTIISIMFSCDSIQVYFVSFIFSLD